MGVCHLNDLLNVRRFGESICVVGRLAWVILRWGVQGKGLVWNQEEFSACKQGTEWHPEWNLGPTL